MTDFNNILSKVSSKDGLSDEESYFSFNYIYIISEREAI